MSDRVYALATHARPGAWDARPKAERARLLTDYFTWVEELLAHESYLGGEGLSEDGVQLRVVDGQLVDSPLTELREIISGFFLVRAPDLEGALVHARACPALTHGRSVSVHMLESPAGPIAPAVASAVVLVLAPDDTLRTLSPEQLQDNLISSLAWMDAAPGALEYSEPLATTHHTLLGEAAPAPQMPLRAVYAVRDASLEEILGWARDAPSLRHGATLRVHPIWDVAASLERLRG